MCWCCLRCFPSALLALAALVIDLGFARLTQRQMQTAADSAALEGLRWQNVQTQNDLPPAWLADPSFQTEVGAAGHGTAQPATDRQDPPLGGRPGCCRRAFRQWICGSAQHVCRLRRFQRGHAPIRRRTRGELQRRYRSCRSGCGPNHDRSRYAGLSADACRRHPRAGTQCVQCHRRRPRGGDLQLRPAHARGGRLHQGRFHSCVANSSTASAFLVRMRRTNNLNGLDRSPVSAAAGRRCRSCLAGAADGPQQQRQPVERGIGDRGPRHGDCRTSARQDGRPSL